MWNILFLNICSRHIFSGKCLRMGGRKFNFVFGWLVGCRFESNCPLVGPGTTGEVPTAGVFLILCLDQLGNVTPIKQHFMYLSQRSVELLFSCICQESNVTYSKLCFLGIFCLIFGLKSFTNIIYHFSAIFSETESPDSIFFFPLLRNLLVK